jgi:hypothetical protein
VATTNNTSKTMNATVRDSSKKSSQSASLGRTRTALFVKVKETTYVNSLIRKMEQASRLIVWYAFCKKSTFTAAFNDGELNAKLQLSAS